jgi:hypothetical protein
MSGRPPTIRLAGLLCIAMAPSTFASAGEVYKCTTGGSTAYQDTPCKEGSQDRVQLPKDSITEDAASLRMLARQIAEAADENRRARDALEVREMTEFARARARFSLSRGAPLPSEERNRIMDILAPLREQSLAADARFKSLMEVVRARCPGGAVLNPSRPECRQK